MREQTASKRSKLYMKLTDIVCEHDLQLNCTATPSAIFAVKLKHFRLGWSLMRVLVTEVADMLGVTRLELLMRHEVLFLTIFPLAIGGSVMALS